MSNDAERCTGDGLPPDLPDRGYLPWEPCRFCHRLGGVWFVVDDSPHGRNTEQIVSCDHCRNVWTVMGGMVPAL